MLAAILSLALCLFASHKAGRSDPKKMDALHLPLKRKAFLGRKKPLNTKNKEDPTGRIFCQLLTLTDCKASHVDIHKVRRNFFVILDDTE